MYIDDLDTPILVIDLDALEHNLERYQRYFDGHGIGLRPHIKTHKTLAIAARQLAGGAMGLTCQKVGEAETMVWGGLQTDIMIPYNILGKSKLDRLMALARQTRITASADSAHTVRGYSASALEWGVTLGVVVELECGHNRTGVATAADALALGKLIDSLPGLELRGIMGFPTPPSVRPFLQETIHAFEQAGLPCSIVSGGGTPYALEAHLIPELTEYRVGEYIVGGEGHLRAGRHAVEECALRVLATVVSRPTEGRAILDSGSKTMSASTIPVGDGQSMGYIVEYPDARFYGASEEHGHVDVSACARKPQIGERVQVLPVHPCPCVNEHNEIVAHRAGRVEAVWPVLARGKVR